jgi:hypothetical protein
MQMVAVTYFRAEADSRITIFYAAGNETDITFLIMIIFDAAIVTVPLRRVNCFHEPALLKRCKIRKYHIKDRSQTGPVLKPACIIFI